MKNLELNHLAKTKISLIGRKCFAPQYDRDAGEENYLITALPPLPQKVDIFKHWALPVLPSQDERNLSLDKRLQKIRGVKRFVLLLSNFVTIFVKIPKMIKQGYECRDPLDNDYLQRIDTLRKEDSGYYENFLSNISEINEKVRSTADMFTLIGVSGVGKTTAVELGLLAQPQLIVHSKYNGKPCPVREQIVWVKLECPQLRTALCREFFATVDDILMYEGRKHHPNYYKKFGGEGLDVMIQSVKTVVANHGIGLLVIDEIQHLMNKGADNDKILEFLVQLVNKVSIPIILIGTPKANPLLQLELMMTRRACDEGSLFWDRMPIGEEWDYFINKLWGYQWTKTFVPLNEELKEVMYDESQGITAIAVNLFRLSQERALLRDVERLSVELIRDVARNELAILQPMIEAYRTGKPQDVLQFADMDLRFLGKLSCKKSSEQVYNSVVDTLVTEKQANIKTLIFTLRATGSVKYLKDSQLESLANKAVKQLEEGWFEEPDRVRATIMKAFLDEEHRVKLQREKKDVPKKKPPTETGDLRHCFDQAKEKGCTNYEILKSLGFIREPMELFEELA